MNIVPVSADSIARVTLRPNASPDAKRRWAA
jgi:hypothetical protein